MNNLNHIPSFAEFVVRDGIRLGIIVAVADKQHEILLDAFVFYRLSKKISED